MSGSSLIPEARRVEYRKIVWPNDFSETAGKLEGFCRKERQTCSRFEVVVTYGNAAEQIIKGAASLPACA